MAYNHIVAGERIEITDSVCFEPGQAEFAELVSLPLATLIELRQASIQQEEAIYKKLYASTSVWAEQAVKTLRLTRAMEYVKTMPVTHTSNVWITNEYGKHEISNMVYKMIWSVYEDTKWDRAAQKSVIVAWRLSWDVYYNAPHNADYMGHGRISGQERKRFTDKAEMEKYLQGRIAAYAKLFTELSPPIPEDQRGRFSVNGCLLPGYTMEQHEPTVMDLLEYLDDDDIPEEDPKENAGQDKETPSSPLKKYAQKKPSTPGKKKPTPTR